MIKSVSLSYESKAYVLFVKYYPVSTYAKDQSVNTDLLLLPNGQTVLDYKTQLKAQQASIPKEHRDSSDSQRLMACSMKDFGLPWHELIAKMRNSLWAQYERCVKPLAQTDALQDLIVCAHQGHLPASVTLGLHYAKMGSSLCLPYCIAAHNQGYQDGLLNLTWFFHHHKRRDLVLQCVLLSANCGNQKSRQLCYHFVEQDAQVPAEFIDWIVMEEACNYGSMHAMYMLGYLKKNGDLSYRDLQAAHKHFTDAQKLKIRQREQVKTLGGYNNLCDRVEQELFQLQMQESESQFMVRLSKINPEADNPNRHTDFTNVMEALPQMPERFVKRLNQWMNSSSDDVNDGRSPEQKQRDMEQFCKELENGGKSNV